MTKKTFLITGGCRSGKSRHALKLGNLFPGRRVYLASAEPLDEEMEERIKKHQIERGTDWITIEEALDPSSVLKNETAKASVLILDCLTLWISNMMMKDLNRESILKKVDELMDECKRFQGTVILITNEVGAGIVPDNELSRSFRDIAGETNQKVAFKFDEVVHMVSGIPVTIKSESPQAPSEAKDSPHEFSQEKKQGLYEAIYKRRDVRHFISRPVAPEVLGRVLDAAHHAGSVGFMQPWNFLVIDDENVKKKVARNFKKASDEASEKFSGEKQELYKSLKLEGITEASVNICITCDSKRFGPNVLGRDTIKETDLFSTCCAVQNFWLAARAEGLAVGWVSILSQKQLKKDLGIPEHVFPVAYLCLGHTEEFYEKPMLESAGWANRLPLRDLIFYNKWEGDPIGPSIPLPGPVL